MLLNREERLKMSKLWFGLFIALILITHNPVYASRAIPDDNLAYPVLISLDTGSNGSGFFINAEKHTFLVTTSHVLFDEISGNLKAKKAKLLSYSKNPSEVGRNIFELDLVALLESKRIRIHSTEDVCIVSVFDVKNIKGVDGKSEDRLSPVSGVSAIETIPSGILGVDIKDVKSFNDVLTANTIYLFGYPTSIGIKEIPQIDPLRPLLRFGIIAGTNPVRKTIILDCPSYPGNSGGPVLEVDEESFGKKRFQVIGVLSQFVPFAETWVNITHKYQNLTISNSGYAIAVSMDPVLELINKP
jgi:hypothetical protein